MAIFLEFLQSEMFLYIVVVLNAIWNMFNSKKVSKLSHMTNGSNIVQSDLQALIDYHKKVVVELEKKQNDKKE